jgi:hypothetical protein
MRFLLIFLFLFLNCKKENTTAPASSYDPLITADQPISFWNNGSGKDLTNSHRDGVLTNGPSMTTLPNGDQAMAFNGINQFMEVANDPGLSVTATNILTIEAWMRPDALDFAQTEGSGYVYWLGKGVPGQHEYAARMYGQHPTGHDSNRLNRISGYVFNNSGGEGAGSYYQAPAGWRVQKGEWMLYVFIINTSDAALSSQYPTGYTKLYFIRLSNNQLNISKDQDALINYNIIPTAGTAPFRVGTRNFNSYFNGAVGKLAMYNYELGLAEITKHANSMFQIK